MERTFPIVLVTCWGWCAHFIASLVLWAFRFFFCNCGLNLFFLQSIVLVNFLEDGSMSVTGIMGHAVQTVEIVNEGDHSVREKLMHLFMSGDCKAYSPEDLEKRKNSLKKWLEKNHIPITEQRDSQKTLCVAGVLTIDPPYGPENCNSSNEIILSRVQDLIQGHLEASQWEAKNYGCTDWNKISYFWKFFVVLGKIKDGDYWY